ncbi:hypothetical protein CPB86DRAFT_868824 [Serendipita vermifera]|nr:hypothetical protein CPB86DRAFT_868824 [Serendipita vermifera]
MSSPQQSYMPHRTKKLRFPRNTTVTYYCVEIEQNLIGRITELNQTDVTYTIRRESGVLDTVEDRHVVRSEPTY